MSQSATTALIFVLTAAISWPLLAQRDIKQSQSPTINRVDAPARAAGRALYLDQRGYAL